MASRRKLVDTWVWKHKGVVEEADPGDPEGAPVQHVRERVVEVELRLVKESADSEAAPHPLSKASFEVFCADPKFSLVGTDVEALRVAAWSRLRDEFKIKWNIWFLVSVDRSMPYGGGVGTGLVFKYETVERGEAPDGTLLMRQYVSTTGRDPWKISPWPGEFKDNRGNVMACIEATEANREALDQFAKGVDAMRERIADFLRPDQILHTLANLSQVGLSLTGPEKSE